LPRRREATGPAVQCLDSSAAPGGGACGQHPHNDALPASPEQATRRPPAPGPRPAAGELRRGQLHKTDGAGGQGCSLFHTGRTGM